MKIDNKDALVYIGELIRTERKKRGWTAEELAYQAQVNKNTVTAIENGRGGNIRTVINLFETLRIKPSFTPMRTR